jgi:hypothetical protein
MPIWANFLIEGDAFLYKLAKIQQSQSKKLFQSNMGQSKPHIFHHSFRMSIFFSYLVNRNI